MKARAMISSGFETSQPGKGTMRIAAVVLAAGEGRRIGGPKALLRVGGMSFLAAVARVLDRPSVAETLAVLGHEADRVRREADLDPRVRVVVNPRYREGMLGSILVGLDAAEAGGAEAILIHPVDHPLVAPETVDRVLAALLEGAVAAVPSHAGRRGHPGGFGRKAWEALRSAPPARGARVVLADHPEWVVHVAGDPGCVAGINTLGDYQRLLGRTE